MEKETRMRSILISGGTLCVAVFFVAGCSERQASKESWRRLTPETMTASEKGQQKQALAAKKAMFNQLMARLKEELAKGPAHAIAVCQQEAPRIAQQVAKDKNVKIGRTALKVRNPQNQPPAWARELIDQSISDPAFLKNDNGTLAALLPIKLLSQCQLCHGPAEQIPPEVRDALSQRYPNDQATGFKEGDLRGWFWIEVPANH